MPPWNRTPSASPARTAQASCGAGARTEASEHTHGAVSAADQQAGFPSSSPEFADRPACPLSRPTVLSAQSAVKTGGPERDHWRVHATRALWAKERAEHIPAWWRSATASSSRAARFRARVHPASRCARGRTQQQRPACPTSGLRLWWAVRGVLAQPRGELGGVAAFGGLCRGELVVTDPCRAGAAHKQQFGGFALTAVRGAPQRVVEVLG